MSVLVTAGSLLKCTCGNICSPLNVKPKNILSKSPVANILDKDLMVNVSSFGMCNSPANPAVQAATAAALGVPTPAPCVPAIAGAWAPGSPTVMVGGKPAVNNTCKLACSYAGVISITKPVQNTTMVK